MRKAEVEAVEALLHEPAEDATELARRIVKALDNTRDSDEAPRYIAVRWLPGGVLAEAIGPWPGPTAARKAMESGRHSRLGGTRCVVLPLYGRRADEAVLERIDP